jgi:predicted transcriptional regulator
MNIDQLISPLVPTLLPSDTANHALELMEDTDLAELPVVLEEGYVALVQEHDLQDWDKPEEVLSAGALMNYKPAIAASSHPFEGMRIMHQMNLSVLPVIDHEQKYIGSVTKDKLLAYMTENSGIDNPGGIIVLEIPPRNYTLYEIARICENEDVIILNLQVHTGDQGMLEVTLKLNRSSLDAVVSSFERHSYRVKEVYGDENKKDDITDKYNLLMNYLNM